MEKETEIEVSDDVSVLDIPEEYLDEACKKCILQNTLKKDHINDKGITVHKKGEFPIRCIGILNPAGYLAMADGDQDQADLLREALDKAYWAKKYLHWEPRATKASFTDGKGRHFEKGYPLQKVMLNCTAKRKVARLGRRWGKTEMIAADIAHTNQTSARDNSITRRIGAKVTLITPAQSQRDEIMGRVRDFLYVNMGLQKGSDITKDKNSPHPYLRSKDGATIEAHVTGTSSNSDGTSIRGKGGDVNFWDEAYFIKDGDYQVMMPLLIEDPDVRLVATSTVGIPEGRFYHFCMDPKYKEFHFSSEVAPFWDKNAELEMRSTLSPLEYKHEILCEFGSTDETVFSDKIRADMFVGPDYNEIEDYIYANRSNFIVTLGIDWNGPTNGTQMYIAAKERHGKKKYLVNCHSEYGDEDGENVQTRAIDTVVRLNRKWIFDSMYFDIGFGQGQYETLRNFGIKSARQSGRMSPDANLMRIKGISFNKSIQIKLPYSKETKSRQIKPFMVDVLRFDMEEGNVEASARDEVLNKQMEMYVIKKITEGGTPSYGPSSKKIGDHMLDAAMLAILPFRIEYSNQLISGLFSEAETVDPYSDIGKLNDPANYQEYEESLQRVKKHTTIKESVRPASRTSRGAKIVKERPPSRMAGRGAARTIQVRGR